MGDEPWFFERFTRHAQDGVNDRNSLFSVLETAREKADRNRGAFSEGIDALMAFIRLVLAWVRGEYRDISTKTVVMIVAAIIYFVTPFDAVPDFIPWLGFTDDLTFVLFVLARVREELDKFVGWEEERWQNRNGGKGNRPTGK
jgi:uncharacterized membrane protein YkvA (DUF1232 family)